MRNAILIGLGIPAAVLAACWDVACKWDIFVMLVR